MPAEPPLDGLPHLANLRRWALLVAAGLLLVSACGSPPPFATPGNAATAGPTPEFLPPSTPAEAASAYLTPSVSSPAPEVTGDGPITPSDLPGPLAGVNDFLYQLQDIDLSAIGRTAYDLVIIDYSSSGGEDGAFSRDEISALKDSPGGSKTVLAYMSIGEAEDYRSYWRSGWEEGDPAWLEAESPDWAGNYKVRYWDPGWQAVVFEYVDRLLAAGFDGAYLDIIDAYEYFAGRGRAGAAQEMVGFVAAIAHHVRARDPGFYIFPQNAPELAGLTTGYLDTVDGIGQEDLYFGYEADGRRTPPSVTAEMERHLDLFREADKLVLTVDYATSPSHVADAYARSRAKGYVPYVTVRVLDKLTINAGNEPD